METILIMKASVFGAKYTEGKLAQFRENTTKILKDLRVEADTSYFETSVNKDYEDLSHIHNKIKKLLNTADVIIVEHTEYSVGIGLIIGKAVEMKKPVLALFNTNAGAIPSLLVKAQSMNDNKFYFKEYSDEQSLKNAISEFVTEAKKQLNTKFLFNLSPEMARYLQWGSETYNRPMVEILRELIQNKMDTDKDWIEYTSSEIK